MKFSFAALLMLTCMHSGFAQKFKNKTLHSLDFSYSSTKNNYEGTGQNSKSSYLSAGVSSGYFVTDKFVVGLGVNYYHQKLFSEYSSGRTEKVINPQVGFSAFSGLYQQIASSRFYYTPMFRVSYTTGNGRGTNFQPGFPEGITENKTRSYGFELRPLEFSYSISKSLFVGAGIVSIRYTKTNTETIQGNNTQKLSSSDFVITGSGLISNFHISYML